MTTTTQSYKLINILLLIFLGAGISSTGQVPEKKLDSLFSDWDQPDTPGGAVGVIKEGQLIFARGYGLANLEHDIPITPSSVFYIGSTGKQFTAFCILLLAERRKLDLDDEIHQYLPDFPRYGAAITIRHLIDHTSGIRDYSSLWDLQGTGYLEHISAEETYRMLQNQSALNFTPGDEYLYNNSGYFLMSEIVEKASGMSLKEFAYKNIFKPLSMDHTLFLDDNRDIIKNRVFGYEKNDKGGFNNLIRRFELVGSGGVYSSIENLYLWDQNFYNNKLGKGGQSIVNEMYSSGYLNNGTKTGSATGLVMGKYKGLRQILHGGSHGGFKAQLLRFPEQNFSVVILANRSDANVDTRAYQVADLFLSDLYIAEQSKTITDQTFQQVGQEELSEIEGDYINRKSGIIRKIIVENGTPYYYRRASRKDKLSAIGENEFQLIDLPSKTVVKFGKDKNGVTTLSYYANDIYRSTLHRYRPEKYTNEELALFEGKYYCADIESTYELKMDESDLLLMVNHKKIAPLTAVTTDVLSGGSFGTFFFERDKDKKITGFKLNSRRVRNVRFLKQ